MPNEGSTFIPVTQEENPLLWALQQYQKVIRTWISETSAVEFVVLMQIVDRTVGWQKTKRTIPISQLSYGGNVYRGIDNAVKRAALMNALRTLEEKGMITRRSSNMYGRVREFTINLDWTPPPRTQVSDEDELADLNEDDYAISLYEQSMR